jgi:ribosomal protein S18 acetylase RimI-like enzyme
MYVKPQYRRKGISQRVLDELISWAKSRDLDEIRLDVYDDNQNAIRAYEKRGFKKHFIEMRMEI